MRKNNKIFIAFLLIMFTVILVSCDISEVDPPVIIPDPEVVILYEGNLNQEYLNEESVLTPVTFSLEFRNFEENEIDISNALITWFSNNVYYGSDEEITIQPIIPSTTTVYANVLIEGEVYETSSLNLRVVTQTVNINIENDVTTGNEINITLGEEQLDIEFTAIITGTTNVSELIWVVLTLNESGLELSSEEVILPVEDGEAIFNYRFDVYGNYRVEARYRGFNSNYIYVNVTYGDFQIISSDDLVHLVDQESYQNINLLVPELSIEGTYQWYLNDEPIDGAISTEFAHSNHTIGQYKYHVVFTPYDSEAAVQISDPKLIVYGVGVSSEAELLAELANETSAIVFLNDIEYSKLDTPSGSNNGYLNINYPVVISGNGHTFTSQGIFTFIRVTSDDVSFHNITLSRAGRYTTHVINVNNVYFENVIFPYPGTGQITEPGAGIYVQNSTVTINNVEFIEGFNSGVRIEGTDSRKAELRIYGDFIYDISELAFPIISIGSNSETARLIGTGFDSFVLPLAENALIRRWSRDAKPITWNLHAPYKAEYQEGEVLDLSGIAISVSMLESNLVFGISFVRMFLDMFNQHGTVLITDLDDNVLKTFYVVGFDEEGSSDPNLDNLIYHDAPVDGEEIDMVLDGLLPGQYKVKIDIGGELYLGFFIINIH